MVVRNVPSITSEMVMPGEGGRGVGKRRGREGRA